MDYNTNLNIRNVVEDSLFYGGDTVARRSAIIASETGINYLTRCVKEILDSGISPLCVEMHDLADLLQVSYKDLKKYIDEAQRNARVSYDGYYNMPTIEQPEQVIYQMVADTIYEIGRLSCDVDEYTVLTTMGDVFSEIETQYDMLSYGFIIDWAVFSLRHDREFSLSSFLKEDPVITRFGLQNFIKKQPWYDSESECQNLLLIPARSRLSKIGTALYDLFHDFRSCVKQVEGNRVYSSNKPFLVQNHTVSSSSAVYSSAATNEDCSASLADEIDNEPDDISSLFNLPDDDDEVDSPIDPIFSDSDEDGSELDQNSLEPADLTELIYPSVRDARDNRILDKMIKLREKSSSPDDSSMEGADSDNGPTASDEDDIEAENLDNFPGRDYLSGPDPTASDEEDADVEDLTKFYS